MEYVTPDNAKYAYRGTAIFEQILEFYAYLNSWSVKEVNNKDYPDSYCYDYEEALKFEEELIDRVAKINFILEGLKDMILLALSAGEKQLKKCKDELVE